MPLSWKSTHNDEIKNLSEANGMKVQVTDNRFSLKKKEKMLKTTMDTLNDNVDNAKSCQWKRFILQFAAKKIFRESIS